MWRMHASLQSAGNGAAALMLHQQRNGTDPDPSLVTGLVVMLREDASSFPILAAVQLGDLDRE